MRKFLSLIAAMTLMVVAAPAMAEDSPKGEAGIGRPTEDGWKWEPAPGAANQILLALEVIEGKHVPTFVPLPIKIR